MGGEIKCFARTSNVLHRGKRNTIQDSVIETMRMRSCCDNYCHIISENTTLSFFKQLLNREPFILFSMTGDGGKTYVVNQLVRKFNIIELGKDNTTINHHRSNVTMESTLLSSKLVSSPDDAMQLLTLDRGGDQAVLSIQKEAADVEAFIANQELESTKVELQRSVIYSRKKDRQLIMFRRQLKEKEDEICNLKLEIDLAQAEKKMLRDYHIEEKKDMMEQRHHDYKYYKHLRGINMDAPNIQSPLCKGGESSDIQCLAKFERKRNKVWKRVKDRSRYMKCSDANLKFEKSHSRSCEVKDDIQGVIDSTQYNDQQIFLPSTRRSGNRNCSNCFQSFLHSSGRDRVTTSSNAAKST